ncbi:MAG: SAM-dependent DNA methyltransferase [Clostridia bacterium]|nr:SAM-dependent DNA methyltransferase [Clostridia bacterium]
MITGELKNKIDSLWDIFAAGGLVNPLDVIEQITYLMFIRDLDDSDNLRAREAAMLGLEHKSIFTDEVLIGERTVKGNQLKWSVFHDYPAGQMYMNMQENVFPFIKNLHADKNSAYSKYMSDAIFKLPTPLVLSKVVDSLDGIYAMMSELQSSDVRGDVYEYLLSKIAQSGLNGQFRTPRHIIRMMVELMQPTADDIICDPACGTSGFLVSAGEWLKENRKQEIFFNRERKAHYMNSMFHGYDMDRTMLRIGAMNMMTHGVDNPSIEYRDSLSDQNPDKELYSLILANPPFKGSLDADSVSANLLKTCKTKKTELLFLALFLRMLRTGGRCACIVPDGVLFGSSTAHKAIRKELVENHRLQAVISMPSGVFKPYAGVSTGILIFTKTGRGGTDDVWFYDMQADGFSLDDKRTPVKENDIPDIIARFRSLDNADAAKQSAEPLRTLPLEGKVSAQHALSSNLPLEGKVLAQYAHSSILPLEGKVLAQHAHSSNLPLEGKVSAQPTDEVEKPLYTEHLNPRTAKSFLVPKQEIVDNGYDLSINKYKQTEYKPVEYPPTSQIIAELKELEKQIQQGIEELEGMV